MYAVSRAPPTLHEVSKTIMVVGMILHTVKSLNATYLVNPVLREV